MAGMVARAMTEQIAGRSGPFSAHCLRRPGPKMAAMLRPCRLSSGLFTPVLRGPQRFWAIGLRLLSSLLVLMALMPLQARAQADFRDPADQPFVIWPNIPVVRATDFAEYAADRKAFEELHGGKGDPATIVAALQAVDQLQAHHDRAALAELGRSLNVLFISEMDRLTRATGGRRPKLRFDFAGITPSELQRPALLDANGQAALRAKAGQVTLLMYMTYSRTEGSNIQVTATLLKPADGSAQSFTVTALASQAAASLAQDVFHYFYSTRFTPHRNPLSGQSWIQPAASHADAPVSHNSAQRFCRSQGAQLPSRKEMEEGELAGIYNGGIAVKSQWVYHTSDGALYVADATAERQLIPNPNLDGNNGHYYCITAKAGAKKKR